MPAMVLTWCACADAVAVRGEDAVLRRHDLQDHADRDQRGLLPHLQRYVSSHISHASNEISQLVGAAPGDVSTYHARTQTPLTTGFS